MEFTFNFEMSVTILYGILLLCETRDCILSKRMNTWFGDRAFWVAGLKCWNRLPAAIDAANLIDLKKTGLKTY